MLNIIIADDHEIVREGLKKILAKMIDMNIADEASTGEELLSKLRKNNFDLVILDISMPGAGGIETLKEIKMQWPKLPVLILSMHPEEQYAIRTLKEGASGYITKDSISDKLIEAINIVSKGRKYVSPIVAEKLAAYFDKDYSAELHEKLSGREFQVMRFIATGKTVSQIGDELNLSHKTISTYRTRILEKMQMKTNAELTHYVINNKLIE
jgi:DNA-binding NarL/FixJ family response regulator